MVLASQVLTGIVAALHVYFMVLEMFLWTTPYGAKTFGRTVAQQEASKTLAQNQGLYNGFLAAGLVWSLVANDAIAYPIRAFFLGCVVVAGLYGAITVNKKILFVQGLPAGIALLLTLIAR